MNFSFYFTKNGREIRERKHFRFTTLPGIFFISDILLPSRIVTLLIRFFEQQYIIILDEDTLSHIIDFKPANNFQKAKKKWEKYTHKSGSDFGYKMCSSQLVLHKSN